MIEFAWPWVAALLPLPAAARAWLAPAPEPVALRAPVAADFQSLAIARPRPGTARWRLILAACAWLALIAAGMRPQWLGEALDLPVSGRDLVLAVDLSGSMETADFQLSGTAVDRLEAAKAVAADFIRRRTGDRIGLILFGRQAYVQAPLTFDRATVGTLLEESFIGMAGKETAIGDAIALAVKRAGAGERGRQVLILLTDGANTAGEIEPLQAAALAARAGLKIYTIGIGAEQISLPGLFGSRTVNPSADLDEAALRGIAQRTGGRYFRARDTAELERIYGLIDQLEPVAGQARQFRPRSELFFWPLAAALALAAVLARSS
ncbi:MAG: VWA domain-containing protein [Gammaproteobacteria bacterium]